MIQPVTKGSVMALRLPLPVLPDPTTVPSLRWGIVGTSHAGTFARTVAQHTKQRIVAVTARDKRKTEAFARKHGIQRVHATLHELVDDSAVDAVYIATPHPLHREQALAAVAASKHVLIEKPIAMSAAEAAEITSAGAAAGVLVMEAMWTRYLPQADVIRRVLGEGIIGEVHNVTADFGFAAPYDPMSRLWDPELGGGALLDAGIYPISFASSVLGSPHQIIVDGNLGPGGVDARADLMLSSAGGRALISTSLVTQLPIVATISGTEGGITLGAPFFGATPLTVTRGVTWPPEKAVFVDERFAEHSDGLGLQATAFASYVGEGRIESPLHPHAEVIDIMHTIDVARAALTSKERFPHPRANL